MDETSRDWSQPLSRHLRLKNGRELVTLADAAELLGAEFNAVTKSATLESAITLLLRAAETGHAVDRRAATEQVEILLRLWHRL